MKKYSHIFIITIFSYFFVGGVYAFTEPSTITITKPTPQTTKYIDASANGDYTTFEAADQAYSGLTPPVKFIVRPGSYVGFTWNSSGSSGNEIVFEMESGTSSYATILNNGSSTTVDIRAHHIIFDGGPERLLKIDGTNGTGDHYMVRLNNANCHDITFWRIYFDNAKGGTSGKAIIPENDNIKIYNCIVEGSYSVGIYVSNGDNIEVRNNIVRNNGGTGVQANPHSSGYSCDELVISGNAIFDNGFSGPAGDRPGIALLSNTNTLYDVYVYNNIIWGNKHSGINVRDNSNLNVRIYANTVINNVDRGFWIMKSAVVDIRNNVVYNNGPDNSHNWINWGDNHYPDCANCSHNWINQNGDPQFISNNPSSADYLKLYSNSSAIDAGEDLSTEGINVDYLGNSRPKYGGYDIGAHEYTVQAPQNLRITSID